jgi:hypothetical protein
MAEYKLLLERLSQAPRITVSCVIVGQPNGYFGLSKTFQRASELSVALSKARIVDFEMDNALTTVRSGHKSFAPITYDQAQSMGLLGEIKG